jgi:hypothetical protein
MAKQQNIIKQKKDDGNIKKFILEFFNSLNSKITEENNVLTIDSVPSDFEEFVGKKAPYILVFDFNDHNKTEDSELIVKGSYFLFSIRDYMKTKGQTSLLKINLNLTEKELNKNPKLKKYKILEIKKDGFESLEEFNFLSSCQYLNEKKDFTNKILIQDNEILDLDLNNFITEKGNIEEIKEISSDNEYEIARAKLKAIIKDEIKPVKEILKTKLEKELTRVKEHYHKQIKEKDEEIERCFEKIKLFESKLKHTYYERDARILQMKIKESKVQLEELKKRDYKERLQQEENFHINDETDKHALTVDNHLVNITVIYYSLYSIKVSLKGKVSGILYDPVLDKVI